MKKLEDYKKDELTVDLMWANVFGLIILIPTFLVYSLPYYFLWKQELIADFKNIISNASPLNMIITALIVFATIILGIIFHELIHGLVFAKFAKGGFKSIKFGIFWKMLTPYCHCKEALKVKHYILGAVMPAIILGIIPAIAAIAIGNFWLLIFGIFFTHAACGDFLIINLLRKEDPESFVQDHPSEAGCYIFRQ